MEKGREWVVDRSQNMGPNYRNIFRLFRLAVTVQKNQWAVVLKLCNKMHVGYEKGREWATRSVLKHGTEIVGILETCGLYVTVQKTEWAVVL